VGCGKIKKVKRERDRGKGEKGAMVKSEKKQQNK